MSPESKIEQAEGRVAKLQGALDDTQKVLHAADKAQKNAEQAAERLRKVSIGLAVGGSVIIVVLLLRHRSATRRLG